MGNLGGGRDEEAAEPGVEHFEVGLPRSHSSCADKNLRKHSTLARKRRAGEKGA